MKNILLVGDFLEGSGLTNVLINTYKHFSKDKYKISVLKYGGSNNIDAELNTLGWDIYSVTPITKNPVRYLLEIRQFFKFNSRKFDVVHFNYSASWNFIGVKLAAQYKIPKIIIHSHNTNYSKNSNVFVTRILDLLNKRGKKIFSNVGNIFLATSQDAMEWMFDTDLIRDKRKYIFKNGIDVDKFEFSVSDRQKLRKSNEIDNNLVIGFMGMLNERKNPIFAIKVFEEVLKINSSAKLFIFGDGPLKRSIEEYISNQEVGTNIKLMGKTKEPGKWLSALDWLVFPSINEGLPLVLLEAQTNGLSIVASDSITEDVKLTNTLYFESLEQTPKAWAQIIVDNIDENRVSKKKKIIEAGFSSEEQSKMMESLM